MKGNIKERIYSTFTDTASSLGYSEVHGRIIGCLMIHDIPMSLSDIAKETGYSASMVSLSVDFLQTVGMIKKIKKPGDRKLYLESDGNLLDGLRKAVLARIEKKIFNSLQEFDEYKKEIKKSKKKNAKTLLRSIDRLEKEMKKMEKYVKILSKFKLS